MSIINYDSIRQSIEHELGTGSRGWIRIIEHALIRVKQRAEKTNTPCPTVFQIKEKFGELRIYYDQATADDVQKTHIAAAISEANHCCERCGNAARPQLLAGWTVILCCHCAHKYCEERHQNSLSFNVGVMLNEPLRCKTCGYVGQIAWKASGHRCPSCVAKRA